jgi:Predicted permeases
MKKRLMLIAKLFLLSFLLSFVVFHGLFIPTTVLNKLPQIVTIFLSIVIQALPFVLIGVFGSAVMQNIVTVEMVETKLTRTAKLPGILLAIGAGFLFPVCDCGVIPVARRMLFKKVPPYMAIAFLVTAPLVNPITVWATATAFGYNLPVTLIRVGMAILVGIIVALMVSEFFPSLDQLFTPKAIQEWETAADGENSGGATGAEIAAHQLETADHQHHKSSLLAEIFDHANEEFLEVGKFLIIGALIASIVQTVIPRQSLMAITQNPALSVVVMMALALSLSLCAEADAFVARSFTYHFPLGSVMAFMVFGQMIDIKNTALLLKSFKLKAILFIFGLCAILVLILCTLMNLTPIHNLMRGGF